jgi:hypothetical protein
VLPVLSTIAKRDGVDPWMRAAILSSVNDSAGELFETLLATTGQDNSAKKMRVAMEWKDSKKFEDLLVERLTGK